MVINRKGFLRIIEASIAIIIIAGVLFSIFTQAREKIELNLSEKARDILEEIARDASLREDIITYEAGNPLPDSVNSSVDQRIIESYLNYDIRICDVDSACGLSSYVGEVYSAERSISSTIDTLGPKKIRLFIWRVE